MKFKDKVQTHIKSQLITLCQKKHIKLDHTDQMDENNQFLLGWIVNGDKRFEARHQDKLVAECMVSKSALDYVVKSFT